MHVLRRYRVGVALVALAVILGILVFYRLKDQQARLLLVLTLVLIPTLHVMVETRFPRRVETPHPARAPQGETA